MNLFESSPTPDSANVAAACGGSCRSCPSVGSCQDRVVCRCLGVTEHDVITAIRERGATTVRELKMHTEAGAGCGCCRRELTQYLTVYAPVSAPSSPLIC